MNAKINKILAEVGKVVVIVAGFYLLLCLYDCTRTKQKPIKGKEKVVKQTHTQKADTVLVHDTLLVYSKPKTIIKWKYKPIEFERFNYCDSTTIQTDTITKEGVKVAILDTIRNNSVVGRQTQIISANQIITNTSIDSIFTVRVDTIYVRKNNGMLCATCFGAGFVLGSFTK
jgi:hypothetical protein